jgi:hypothetical protein
MKNSNFWIITLRSPMKVNRHFGAAYRLNFQDQRASQLRKHHEAGSKRSGEINLNALQVNV